MTHDLVASLQDIRLELDESANLLASALAAQSRLKAALNAALNSAETGRNGAVAEITGPICAHRKAHKPGRPAKIDADPELRAFVVARLDRFTFEKIAQDVRTEFGAARAVSRSSIHDWYQRNHRPQSVKSLPE